MNRNRITPPQEVIRHSGGHVLELRWRESETCVIDAAKLRRHCACAYCEADRQRGEASDGDGITLTRVVLAGPDGLQLFFSDGHDRGRFPWAYLHALAAESEVRA